MGVHHSARARSRLALPPPSQPPTPPRLGCAQLPDKDIEDIVHAPLGKNYKVNLGAVSAPSTCQPLLANAIAAQGGSSTGGGSTPAPAPAPEASSSPPAYKPTSVIDDATMFEIVTGENLHYPNPPGWGLSYHVNGKESPVLKVKRGTTYTFKVKAGEYHPLYLTSSIVGGGSINNYAGETVYAGGDTDFGERRAPAAWAGRVRTQRAPAASVLRARARVQTCALPSPAAPQARPPSLPRLSGPPTPRPPTCSTISVPSTRSWGGASR